MTGKITWSLISSLGGIIAILPAHADTGVDRESTDSQFLRGLPVRISPTTDSSLPYLNYQNLIRFLKNSLGNSHEKSNDAQILVRFHSEEETLDLSSLDDVVVTVPLSEVQDAAPNFTGG